jgi:hypothetical protein
MAKRSSRVEKVQRLSSGIVAILGVGAVVLGGALASIPLGCLPTAPTIPTVAIPTVQPELPQAPELQVPTFQPPEIATPEGPDLPAQPPENKGNCCIRTGNLLREKCGGAMSCCIEDFKKEKECLKQKGLWFFTPEGCSGAC